jgi:hypothetical protein
VDTGQLIDLVRREHGIVLDPDDPIFAAKTIARAEADEARTEIRALVGEARAAVRELAGKTGQPIDKETARQLGNMIEITIERHASERVQMQVRRMALTLVGILLATAVVVAGLGFWGGSSWRGAQDMAACRAHQSVDPSGRLGCVIWLEPQK